MFDLLASCLDVNIIQLSELESKFSKLEDTEEDELPPGIILSSKVNEFHEQIKLINPFEIGK